MTVPLPTAVTTTLVEVLVDETVIVAVVIGLILQVPPAGVAVNWVNAPILHKVKAPPLIIGVGFTVITLVVRQPVGNV